MKTAMHNRQAKTPVSHERFGRGLAGTFVLISAVFGYLLSPFWLFVTMSIALNLAISSLTDRCPIKSLLVRLGLPGERDIGRAEAAGEKSVFSRREQSDLSASARRWRMKRTGKEPSEQLAMS